ncbi:class IIb bacteriocin, lactobin A/cerein 7B family [Lapidilactobacillus salsurivasis]
MTNQIKTLNDFECVSDCELSEVEGGFVITGTLVGAAVGIFCGTFAVGYSIGDKMKGSKKRNDSE